MSIAITDFNQTRNTFKSAIGFAAIGFRGTESADYAINQNNFYLNAAGDGWFRKDKYAGIASGYGLMIRNIKITNRKKHYHNGEPSFVGQEIGNFVAYKASIIYETNDFESEVVEDKFWVFVHKQFDIKDVVEYIDTHINEWRA